MTATLTKPTNQLNSDDIQELVSASVPEGLHIEFKESLPSKEGSHPWMQGDNEIGNYTRDEILKEVVGFANSYGGALVLGIAENRCKKPPVAENVRPIPRPAELAERFRHIFRDCIEPQLPTLEIESVPMDNDNGVIVFRTRRSTYGPHRVKSTLICPVRRADRCDSMSMREIQDMTLNLTRGTERLERRLQERSRKFKEEFKHLETPDDAFGFRMTAIPIGEEVRFEAVYSGGKLIEELNPPEVQVDREGNDQKYSLRKIPIQQRIQSDDWRPMLRAARVEDYRDTDQRLQQRAYVEIHADGLLEWGFVSNRHYRHCDEERSQSEEHFDSETPVSTLARLLVWAGRVREHVSAPGVEYAVQPQFLVTADNVSVIGADGKMLVGTITRDSTSFPLYSLEASGNIEEVVSRFEVDLWNYFGKDPDWRTRQSLIVSPS